MRIGIVILIISYFLCSLFAFKLALKIGKYEDGYIASEDVFCGIWVSLFGWLGLMIISFIYFLIVQTDKSLKKPVKKIHFF